MKAISTTFAQFTDNGVQDFFLTNNADGSQTFGINAPVLFTFSNIPGLPAAITGPLSATLNLTATSNASVGLATVAGVTQAYVGGFSGSFAFTNVSNGSTVNLLSGTFGNQGLLLGQNGGQSATFSDTASGSSLGEVHFTSSALAFVNQSEENLGISISSIYDLVTKQGGLNVNGNNIDDFTASGTGTFASNPAPQLNAAVPEASSCALFGLGLFLVGAMRGVILPRVTLKSLPGRTRRLLS